MKLLEGKLPQYTTNTMHTRHDSCRLEHISLYLISMRDPLQRMMSWFRYDAPHPKMDRRHLRYVKPLYIDCGFQSMNQLGEAMTKGGDSANVSDECQQMAWDAITGKRRFHHSGYNYGHYWNWIPPEAKESGHIVAIRAEHMEQDWYSVERFVGGDAAPSSQKTTNFGVRNASKRRSNNDSYLSELAHQNICRGLCEEIQLYKKILERVENLTPQDVGASLKELQQSCPVEAAAEQCPPRL